MYWGPAAGVQAIHAVDVGAGVSGRRLVPGWWIGVAAATVLGAVVRFVGLTGHLPQLLEPDELTTVVRAVGIVQGDVTPPMWDWPPGVRC